jgi:hypothetical protein
MPCYANIPEGDETIEHWADDERIVIFNFLDDIGQPFSCDMWGNAGTAQIPVIVDDGPGHTFHDLFELVLDAYPVNVFLDHEMNVVNITELEMNQAAINNIIQGMVNNIPVNYLDDIQPIFNTSCVSCHDASHPSGLNLMSYSDLMDGSNNGDVITPLDHSASVLWQSVNSGGMPLNSDDLISNQIDLIAAWIDQGALECPDSDPDECGVCDGDNSTCADCAGIPNGDSFTDNCDECVVAGDISCVEGCDGNYTNNGTQAVYDLCISDVNPQGVCGGDNSTCTDCNDAINGLAYTDGCGNCVGDGTGAEACATDCNGEDGGTAFIDFCWSCVDSGDTSCVQGCDGNYANDGTQEVYDLCISDINPQGVCGGDNSTCTDCAGVPNGDSFTDNCGDCVGGDTGVEPCVLANGNDILPLNFKIEGIYPNPFNPVVNIEYSLATSDLVNISIYDLNGQIVDQLFTGNQVVGNHHISWHASEMSSGIYIIIIQSGNIILSDQLILLK